MNVVPSIPDLWQKWRMAVSDLHKVAREKFSSSFEMSLPGDEYERFPACEGHFTEWKSAPSPIGKAVIFKTYGKCAMPLHFHESGELLTVISGVLSICVEAETFILRAGDSHFTEPNKAHSAHYLEPGECFCLWPSMQADSMTVDVLV